MKWIDFASQPPPLEKPVLLCFRAVEGGYPSIEMGLVFKDGLFIETGDYAGYIDPKMYPDLCWTELPQPPATETK